jgi:CheY-like chemotaxis protein
MPRILVVDDQSDVVALIAITLEGKGIEVIRADCAAAALRAFESSTFDVAIVDIFIPATDGLQIIAMLRDRAPHLPIIAMSGALLPGFTFAELGSLPGNRNIQHVVCLGKPFRSRELMAAIGQAIDRRVA